ncbi:GNAT family N-acetyltransferase [uncultured Ramlibacter sp.]|uniref:GNAT family N-acetyltransferase n=1 Tax=uncultured Ramlibacter sp. TaxID=260755 RepID=UPI00260BF2C9|nr:GNAT family N-acetyltransferase [uncultured Ramlibacter sp.]
MAPLRIRTMGSADMAQAIEWAAQEGWNPGLHDGQTFHAADPEGFLVGEQGGRPVAAISVVRYGTGAGFLGLYIVLPDVRGQGLGWQLWQAGMARLAGRQVGLDGVPAQQANYRKSGFRMAWRNARYEGRGLAGAAIDPRIVPLDSLPFETVRGYDAPFFPDDRAQFLRDWIAQPQACALGFVNNGSLQGYGLVRPCRSGHKIGPLFADSEAAAQALYLALATSVPAQDPLYLDIAEPNAAALALARRHGMTKVFETARMYTGSPPVLPLDRMYGITSFELG